jgi:CHAD domain-containing protein
VLHRRSRKLLKRGDGLADAPIAALHAMRLSAKRLRYAGEFFAPLFPAKAAKRYLRRLAALQEALGIVNDGAVAGSLVRALPAAAGEAAGEAVGEAAGERAWAEGALHGYAAARAKMARRDAAAAWRRFRKTAPFWTG